MNSPSLLERWEDRTELPLACVAVVFLAIYSVKVLAHPGGPRCACWTWRCGRFGQALPPTT